MTRPERKADDRQRESLRAEMHDALDAIMDFWPTAEKQAREMGAGFPSSSLSREAGRVHQHCDTCGDSGETPHGSPCPDCDQYGPPHSDPTGEAVATSRSDPAVWAGEFLKAFDGMVAAIKALKRSQVRLTPADPDEARKAAGDELLPLCSECGLVLLPGFKVKRIDNDPLHLESPGKDKHGEPIPVCYWQRYRRMKALTA